MSGLKQLKLRIAGVQSTRKVTKAMQLVAASKLRRAQEAAQAARPYAAALATVLANLRAAAGHEVDELPLLVGNGRDDRVLLLVITSDRGLCGGFNAAVVRAARAEYGALVEAGRQVRIQCIGRKGYDALARLYPQAVEAPLSFRSVKRIGYAEAKLAAETVLSGFAGDRFDVCRMVSSHFRSVLLQEPTVAPLLPVADAPGGAKAGEAVYEFEPDPVAILSDLLPRSIAARIYSALLDSAAGEQAARMSAMDNASRNAERMTKALTLTYNRTRQANITKELIEIISGAEAL